MLLEYRLSRLFCSIHFGTYWRVLSVKEGFGLLKSVWGKEVGFV